MGLANYFSQINEFPLLSEEREQELAELIAGDCPVARKQAVDELITSNLKMVPWIAKKLGYHDIEELIAEGNLALVQVAGSYGPGAVRFYRYAAPRVFGAMVNFINSNQASPFRLPKGQAAAVRKMKEAEAESSRVLTTEEIAEAAGVDLTRSTLAAWIVSNLHRRDGSQIEYDSSVDLELIYYLDEPDTEDPVSVVATEERSPSDEPSIATSA